MVRLLLGIVKGGVVGAALGFVAWKGGIGGGGASWILYGIVGFVVGIVCGKPIWRQETLWTPLLKGLFGVAVSTGLYFGARKLLGGFQAPFGPALGAPNEPLVSVPVLMAPILGMIYGIFVEIDDSDRGAKKAADEKPKTPPTA